MTMAKVMTVIDREAFTAANIRSASIHGDHVEIVFRDGGYVESWGEHGPNDFAEYGMRVMWLQPEEMDGHTIINGPWVRVSG